MIRCGWCGATTEAAVCRSCGRDPVIPWAHRGLTPPAVRTDAAGRPALDPRDIRRRLAQARADLGPLATNDALAESLGISARTLGRWQKMAD